MKLKLLRDFDRMDHHVIYLLAYRMVKTDKYGFQNLL